MREYVEAIDVLLRCGAIPEPTYLWWDARLQPRFGTLEVRVMDAQTRAPDTAALAALVQCVVRLEATERWASRAQSHAWEALDENRFIAARDGMRAELIDVGRDRRRPAMDFLDELLDACAPHARELGCEADLARVRGIAEQPGHERQRGFAKVAPGEPAELGPLVRGAGGGVHGAAPPAVAGAEREGRRGAPRGEGPGRVPTPAGRRSAGQGVEPAAGVLVEAGEQRRHEARERLAGQRGLVGRRRGVARGRVAGGVDERAGRRRARARGPGAGGGRRR